MNSKTFAKYEVQGWVPRTGKREYALFDTWEEVLSLIAVLEEDQYQAVTVSNRETGLQVISFIPSICNQFPL